MLIRNDLNLIHINEVKFEETESKFHFKTISGVAIIKLTIPTGDKTLANTVIDTLLKSHHSKGYINLDEIVDLSNHIDNLIRIKTQNLDELDIAYVVPKTIEDLTSLETVATIEELLGVYLSIKDTTGETSSVITKLEHLTIPQINKLLALLEVPTVSKYTKSQKLEQLIAKLDSLT